MTDTVKTTEELLGLWSDLLAEVDATGKDLEKALSKGNDAASRRVRARARGLRKVLGLLSKSLVERAKEQKASKKKEVAE